MRYRLAVVVTVMVASVLVAAPTSAAAAPSTQAHGTYAAAATAEPNDADIQFARMMIPHHYQALVMTRLAPDRSADDEVRALAERINVGQGLDIVAMRGWQRRNGLQVTDPQESYQDLLEHPDQLEEMGMATPAELGELKSANGNEFDVLFLQLMIPHHLGAIAMAEDVAANGRDITLRQLAIDMMGTQRAQVQTMRDILADKTG